LSKGLLSGMSRLGGHVRPRSEADGRLYLSHRRRLRADGGCSGLPVWDDDCQKTRGNLRIPADRAGISQAAAPAPLASPQHCFCSRRGAPARCRRRAPRPGKVRRVRPRRPRRRPCRRCRPARPARLRRPSTTAPPPSEVVFQPTETRTVLPGAVGYNATSDAAVGGSPPSPPAAHRPARHRHLHCRRRLLSRLNQFAIIMHRRFLARCVCLGCGERLRRAVGRVGDGAKGAEQPDGTRTPTAGAQA
jgi:hypothetical protein